MHIKFNRIRWKNLLATGNDWIEIVFFENQRTLIYGDNGHGKSTLLDALTLALFGKAFRNLNKPLLVNSINGEDCVVELTFTIGTIHYKLVRGIKPNIFEVYQDGKLKDQNAGVYDYQEFLEKNILKFNFKTFKQIMVLGNKSFIPFMQLVALDRRNVIEELLDIQIFSAMSKVARNKLDRCREQITELDHNITVLQEKIDLQKTNIAQMQTGISERIARNEQQISNNLALIIEHQAQITSIKAQIETLEKTTQDFTALQERMKKLTELKAQMTQNSSRSRDELKFYETNTVCPSCHSTIDEEFKQKQIESLIVKFNELHGGLEKITNYIYDVQVELNKITGTFKMINQCRADILVFEEKVSSIRLWCDNLLEEDKRLSTVTFDAENNDIKLQEFQEEMVGYQADMVVLKNHKKHLDVAASLLKDSGIKTSVIKQYLPVMNNFINKYLSYMDFNINFTLNENFEESIMARYRDRFAYENFSAGQQMRIDLALLFAWRSVAKVKNSVDTNILIMDEIVDGSLDDNGIDDFFKLIQTFNDTNIFIISPKGENMLNKFDYAIKFELKQDFSEMEFIQL